MTVSGPGNSEFAAALCNVRLATNEDVEPMRGILKYLISEHRQADPDTSWFFLRDATDSDICGYLRRAIDDQDCTLLVSEAPNGVVTAILKATLDVEHANGVSPEANMFNIHILATHPDFRSQGYGTRLLDEAKRRATEQDASWVRLHVFSFNQQALDLYTRYGFRTLSTKMGLRLEPSVRRFYVNRANLRWSFVSVLGFDEPDPLWSVRRLGSEGKNFRTTTHDFDVSNLRYSENTAR